MSSDSLRIVHPESVADYRRDHEDPYAASLPPLLVDRRRIVQSSAFRRLQHKTQVFVAGSGDHFRTRMTHTLEVADLARSIAHLLGLNAELAELVGLAHDLGHPPFGHAGERALDSCMQGHGGFEHNAHTLRTVEVLEHSYPEFRGLNLTRVLRECLAKHETRYDHPDPHPLQDGAAAPLEGQIGDLADRLAYGLHDLQDGLYAGLFEPEALDDLELWRRCCPRPTSGRSAALRVLRPTIDRMRQVLVGNVVDEARRRAGLGSGQTLGGVSERIPGLIALAGPLEAELRQVEAFLAERVYRSQRLVRMDTKARRVLTAVFEAFVAEPRLLPGRYAERVKEQGAHRVVADYIAGMTDRFCQTEHARLFDARMDA